MSIDGGRKRETVVEKKREENKICGQNKTPEHRRKDLRSGVQDEKGSDQRSGVQNEKISVELS